MVVAESEAKSRLAISNGTTDCFLVALACCLGHEKNLQSLSAAGIKGFLPV